MNNVILVGRLVKEVELRYVNVSEGERAVTRFSLAVDNGNKGTDFFSCVAWNNHAENIAKYVKKGDKLAIQGRLKPNNYKKDNQEIYSIDVVVDRADFMNKPKKEEEGNTGAEGETSQIKEKKGMSHPVDKNVNRGKLEGLSDFKDPFLEM